MFIFITIRFGLQLKALLLIIIALNISSICLVCVHELNRNLFLIISLLNDNLLTGSRTRKCLSNGFWSTKEPPICRTNELDFALPSSGKESIKFIYFLPFYIIAGITSLVLIIIAISTLIYVKKKSIQRDYSDPNHKECPSLTPASCVTDVSYLDDSESFLQFQYQYHNEPIYDIPPNSLKSMRVSYDNEFDKNIITEPIYDQPKNGNLNPNN